MMILMILMLMMMMMMIPHHTTVSYLSSSPPHALQEHAKSVMLDSLPLSCDVLCTHPMFGPESGKYGWQGLPFLYDKVRIEDTVR